MFGFTATIKGRLIFSTLLAATLFLVALGVALSGMNSMSQRFVTFIQHDQAILSSLQGMYAQGLQNGQALRNIIFNPSNAKGHENFRNSAEGFQESYDKALKLTAGNPEMQNLLRQTGESWQQDNQIKARIIELASSDPQAAIATLNQEETPVWREVRKNLLVLIRDQGASAETTRQETMSYANGIIATSLGLALAALLFGGMIMFWVVRNISQRLHSVQRAIDELRQGDGDLTRRLPDQGRDEIARLSSSINDFIGKIRKIIIGVRDAAESASVTATQLNAMTVNVSRDARTQTEGIFQISTAMEEMSNTVKEVANNAGSAANASSQASEVVKAGNAIGQQTMAALNRIDGTVGSSAGRISELNTAIQQIGEVTRVIKDIAEQTNLLALNAAIEAARAGEHGRGFAVVADEVRKLSERTAASTTDIASIVQTVQAGTQQAVSAMDQARGEVSQGVEHGQEAGKAFQQIDSSVRTVTEMMHQIATAAEEQSAVGTEISRNLEQVSRIADSTNQDIQRTTEAVANLAETAQNLRILVNQFKLGGA
ncbi:methyl-accepting chemotaxis protein [Thermithiobacillus plumbiphilus]|uniref:Methyl-accepting chemotaxis protein n=1 Tax=Thermithiobacillus plumbiphilus TaxID=1729899 RepID=A0ABU9D803_9PROT